MKAKKRGTNTTLKSMCADDGTKMFPVTDWLSAQHVASYFSHFVAIAQSRKLNWKTKRNVTEDIENALVERGQRKSMNDLVFQKVDL